MVRCTRSFRDEGSGWTLPGRRPDQAPLHGTQWRVVELHEDDQRGEGHDQSTTS